MAQDLSVEDDSGSGEPLSDDRRAEHRYLTVHWLGKLAIGDTQELCVVRNICSTSLIAQVFAHHPTGEHIRIVLKGGQQLEGEVVWSNEETVEVCLIAPVDVGATVDGQAVEEKGGRPGLPRLDISAAAQLRLGDQVHLVEVRDLSQGGVKIETDALPKLGEAALLSIEGLGELGGAVRWCENGHVGIAFLQPIPFDQLTQWIVARDQKDQEAVATRRWPRYNMFLKSWMQLSGVLTPVEIYIHNLGRGGLMATCRRGLHTGEQVVVSLGRAGDIEGSVVWIDNDHAGISFTRTLEADHARQPFASRSMPPILHHQADGRRPGLKIP